MKEKVREVMSNVLGVSMEEVSDDASPDTIDNWDSLRHMNIILALEDVFDVQFSDTQIVEMLNFQLILLVLKEAGVKE